MTVDPKRSPFGIVARCCDGSLRRGEGVTWQMQETQQRLADLAKLRSALNAADHAINDGQADRAVDVLHQTRCGLDNLVNTLSPSVTK